ncbi:MAG: helix-turn-helix domain-containing protein [Pseudomonadota bacterium]|nr:helix-turn-helix domain-containing protein [Pseudomonadota bacterium]
MLDFAFATHDEICKEIGARLKTQRLAQSTTQADLAARAGVSEKTVKNIENKGQASLDSAVRVIVALGLADHLQPLFTHQVKSIAQMEEAEQTQRMRAPRRSQK